VGTYAVIYPFRRCKILSSGGGNMKLHSEHRQTHLFILIGLIFLVQGWVPMIEKPAQTGTTITPSVALPVIEDTFTPLAGVEAISSQATQQAVESIVEQECIPIEEKMPNNLILSGVWVRGAGKPYLENLEEHTRYEVPLKGGGIFTSYAGDFAVSPDGKHLAYIDAYYNSAYKVEKRILRIIKSSGHPLSMDYWPADWQWLIGWTDNRHIAIFTGNKEILILEPFTGEWKRLPQPSWLGNPGYDYSGYDGPFYSPTLKSVLVQPDYSSFELKDFVTGETLYTGNGQPIRWGLDWSANGSVLAIGSHEFLKIITGDQQIIEFPPSKFGIDRIDYPKLSPDGQKIAFTSSWSGKLFLLDIKRLEVRELCSGEFDYWHRGVWSPESRFMVQTTYDSTYRSFDILIDTEQMRAYKLETKRYQQRLAWLAKP
jgi:hypothetical protein